MNRKPVRQLWFGFAQAEYDLFHANSTTVNNTGSDLSKLFACMDLR
ncbi:hypothetical protein ACFL6U_21745 [Planctomycetota bacterium]